MWPQHHTAEWHTRACLKFCAEWAVAGNRSSTGLSKSVHRWMGVDHQQEARCLPAPGLSLVTLMDLSGVFQMTAVFKHVKIQIQTNTRALKGFAAHPSFRHSSTIFYQAMSLWLNLFHQPLRLYSINKTDDSQSMRDLNNMFVVKC